VNLPKKKDFCFSKSNIGSNGFGCHQGGLGKSKARRCHSRHKAAGIGKIHFSEQSMLLKTNISRRGCDPHFQEEARI